MFAAPLALAALLLAGTAGAAEGPTIEAAERAGYGGFEWKPASAEVGTGGSVTFKNSTSIQHGIEWTGTPPGTPSCSGVPVGTWGTNWTGTCTFTQAGTYSFRCPVHPAEMTGTITVSSSGTVTTGPPPPAEPPESAPGGPPARSLGLARSQRGAVRGSIVVSQAGAGARLEVDLLAGQAALSGAGRGGGHRVGRLVRSALQPGRVSFTVPISGLGRRALRRHGRLPLTVEVIVAPRHGAALKLKRGVVLHV